MSKPPIQMMTLNAQAIQKSAGVSQENMGRQTNAVSGEAIKNYHFKTTEELNAFDFNVSGLSAGMYFIKVYNSSFSYSDKILVK